MKKIERLLKNNRFFQAIYVFFFSLFFKFLGLFIRPNKKMVLFQSLIGKSFGDSPKCIYEMMKGDQLFKDFTFVWAFDNPDRYPECDCKKIKLNSFKYFYYALKSIIWISNTGIERGLRFKHRKTIHINTDHGVAYKKIGNEQKNRRDYNFKTVDLFCCCSAFDRETKIRAYHIKEESAQIVGLPINDKIIARNNKVDVDALRKKYNIPSNKKVILYAPTWREGLKKDDPNNTPPIDLNKWKERLGNEYILMIRAHHLVSSKLKIASDDFVFDGETNIPMEDAVLISDILISDYSSIMFNYSITERPIIAFVYDNDSYQKQRGTYIDPFKLFNGSAFINEDQILDFINSMNYKCECNKTKLIKEKYMYCDGHATEYCFNFLKDRIKSI